MSQSKCKFLMKKYEKIQGSQILFAVFSINFCFWERFGILFNSLKKIVFKKSILKNLFNFLQWDLTKFYVYFRYTKLKDFQVYLLCLNVLVTFLTVLGVFTYFNIAKKPNFKNLSLSLSLSHIQNLMSLLNTTFGKKKTGTWRFELWFGP